MFRSKPVTEAALCSYTTRNSPLFGAWIKGQCSVQFRTVNALPHFPLAYWLHLFSPYFLLHTSTLQLAATGNIKCNINWALGARWRLHRKNFRGERREKTANASKPVTENFRQAAAWAGSLTCLRNTHILCYLTYASPSFLPRNTTGLKATACCSFSFPGKQISTEGWQCCKCHSRNTKHCYFEIKWLIVSSTACSCIK